LSQLQYCITASLSYLLYRSNAKCILLSFVCPGKSGQSNHQSPVKSPCQSTYRLPSSSILSVETNCGRSIKKLSPGDNRQPSRMEYAKCCRLRCDLNICLSFKSRWFHAETTKIAVANRQRFRLLLAVAYG